MKIQCDVCESQTATVFCSADEAALCGPCDHRVHHANKLAGKHLRFSLLPASPADSPICDICQERRAFLFCKEDRAILCRECDVPIHRASEHTQRHSRFLLTAVRVSSSDGIDAVGIIGSPSPYQAPCSSSSYQMQQMGSSDQSEQGSDFSDPAMPPLAGPPPLDCHVVDLSAPPYSASQGGGEATLPSEAQQAESRHGHQYYYSYY